MRKRLDISRNPIFSKLIGKPLRKPRQEFNEKTNVAMAITSIARTSLRENPNLILKFLKFVREGKRSFTTSRFSFKRLKSHNSFLIETKDQKYYVRKIEYTNKERPWGNHAYNLALLMSELEVQGVNTVPVQFAYSNIKKGESYVAYDYKELEKLQTLEKAKKENLFNPATKKFVVFNPEIDLIKNRLEEHKKFTAEDYQLY